MERLILDSGALIALERGQVDRTNVLPDDADLLGFLDALDHPERFEHGLRRLAEHPSILPS